MQRVRKINTENYQEQFIVNNTAGKSPIRRQQQPNSNINKSPLRSRTPTRGHSPIKHHEPLPSHIRYVTGKSPIKFQTAHLDVDSQNHMLVSNGKNIKYVSNNQSNRKEKIQQQYIKFNQNNQNSQRRMLQDNKLFGKMVSKLNSQKKVNPPSNQASYKTSVFAQQSQQKNNKYNTSGKKPENRAFKQIINQVRTGETKSQIRQNFSSGRKVVEQIEEETLSCLVYRMNNQPSERQYIQPNNPKVQELPQNKLIKRKSSKRQPTKLDIICESKKILESNYEDFDILMNKLNEAQMGGTYMLEQDLVKMSMKIQQSLSMDPFM